MKQIRVGVFETNSSSTHSLTVFSKEEYEQFNRLELFVKRYCKKGEKEFLTFDEALEIAKKSEDFCQEEYDECDSYKERVESIEDILREEEIYSTNTLDSNLEQDVTEFKSKSGEEFVILCRYGYDS